MLSRNSFEMPNTDGISTIVLRRAYTSVKENSGQRVRHLKAPIEDLN